jgi:hypothetical protein
MLTVKQLVIVLTWITTSLGALKLWLLMMA